MRILIKNGTIVTASDTCRADILVEDEKIVSIEFESTAAHDQVYDAFGKLIFPGAIDVHTHLDMPFGGTVTADDFATGTTAAAAGGTTCIIDYALQTPGKPLQEALQTWHTKAEGKCAIDYGFHVAVTDLNDAVREEIPLLVETGLSQWQN